MTPIKEQIRNKYVKGYLIWQDFADEYNKLLPVLVLLATHVEELEAEVAQLRRKKPRTGRGSK